MSDGVIVIIGIDYDEFKPETFRGYCVAVFENGEEIARKTLPSLGKAEHFAGQFASSYIESSSIGHYQADLAAIGSPARNSG